ncbi:TPA: hypothetical protein ACXJST_001477 [Stenotrophomonas maltophilia]
MKTVRFVRSVVFSSVLSLSATAMAAPSAQEDPSFIDALIAKLTSVLDLDNPAFNPPVARPAVNLPGYPGLPVDGGVCDRKSREWIVCRPR